MEKRERNRINFRTTLAGLLANLLLCVGKFVVGVLCGNIAVTADAINNLSDAGNNAVTLISVKVAAKPADKRHPFGHERMEYISAFIVAIVILILGVELAVSSVEKIFSPQTNVSQLTDVWMIVVMAVSIAVKAVMFFFYRYNGKRADSLLLRTMSTDSILDVVSSSAVLAAVLVNKYAGVDVSGYVGAAISVFIFVMGVKVLKETVDSLIGTAPSKEFVRELKNRLLAFDGVMDIHDLMVHSYGHNNRFATVHIEVDAGWDVWQTHELADGIERRLSEELGIHLLVHIDPVKKDDAETVGLLPLIEKVLAAVDDNLGFHDVRVMHRQDKNKVVFDMEAPYDLKQSDEMLVALVREKLQAECDCDFAITVDRVERPVQNSKEEKK